MNEKNENSFMETIVNYALVIRTDLDTISEIKKQIRLYPNVEIIYQKYSFKHLVIKEEEGDSDDRQ